LGPRFFWEGGVGDVGVMEAVTILGLALALALDAFAVALTVGGVLGGLSFRPTFRLAWHFGFFQFGMPVLGYAAGLHAAGWIAGVGHWVAFGLLVLIGVKMLVESGQIKRVGVRTDPTRGWSLVGLSVATSVDALAVGLSLAVVGMGIWQASVVIGLVAALMTLLGMVLGRRLRRSLGSRMEIAGGVLLVLIGVHILLKH